MGSNAMVETSIKQTIAAAMNNTSAISASTASESAEDTTSETSSSSSLLHHANTNSPQIPQQQQQQQHQPQNEFAAAPSAPLHEKLIQPEYQWIHYVSFPAFIVDPTTYSVCAWNPSATRLTGIQPQHAVCRSVRALLSFETQQLDSIKHENLCWVSSIFAWMQQDDQNAQEVWIRKVQICEQIIGPSSSASTLFRIRVSALRNPQTNHISGLVCILEREEEKEEEEEEEDTHKNNIEVAAAFGNPRTAAAQLRSSSADSLPLHSDVIESLVDENDCVSHLDYSAEFCNELERREIGICPFTQHQLPVPVSSAAAPAEEYRLMIETANAPIFGVDTNGVINEWNSRIAQLTGISKEHAIGMPILDDGNTFVSMLMQHDMQVVLQEAFQGHGTSNFELEILTHHSPLHTSVRRTSMDSNVCLSIGSVPVDDFQQNSNAFYIDDGDNRSRFLLVNVTPRRNLQNEIVGAIFFGEDVTEACNHDRAVAAMANELRQLIDTANAPIFGIDRDGDVNEWNDKTAEITGYSKEEAFDCSLVDTFIVPNLQDSVHDVLNNALEGRGTSNFEMDFRTKSDEIRHLLVNVTPQRDMDDNIVGVVAIAQDVTEAVQRDRAVAGMALELRQLIDTANAPIFGIDIDGNVNEWNRRTSEITGYSKEEAFDEPLVETFIAPSMQEKVQEILDCALAGNETSNYELEFVSKSGEPIFLLVNATTRRDPENAVVGVVGVAQDVSEDRKHAQALREMQTLRASQEAKVETERNMTAYFAHELRNPLGAIDSALNAMPDDLPESARSLIAGMQLCTGFMSSIMNNLLDVRKMEEGKMQLSQAPISLRRLLNNVHKMLEPSVRTGVEFRTVIDVPKGKSWILGDAHRIQQVMTNVVTNAIKYTVSGYIELFIGWEDGKVKFVCEDTGPGIPKSEQEMLFQRFVQRGGAPGTGLGLAIAKHLVDLTGGTIRFDSDPSIKAGTKCIVLMSLPVCEAPESVVEECTALITEPISFLIIDDIKMNRMMLKRRIKKGIAPDSRIVEAATGEEALEICGQDKFDVIIVDQYMEEAGGVMVGTDVVFAMRRMRIDSVIIGCSGNDMGTQFKDAGADWVWQKPMPSNGKIIQDLRASLAMREGRMEIRP